MSGDERVAEVGGELASSRPERSASERERGASGDERVAELGGEQEHARNPLVVLAGPTAVGKGTVAAYIREHFPEVWLSVSVTTRTPRPGELDGVHYHFISEAEFARLDAEGELLESAVVHGRASYGTPRQPVLNAIAAGRFPLLEIDLQGARQVRARMPDAHLVFLTPPSWEELVRRLVGRGTESAEERAVRLATAREELAAQSEFDATIVNDDVRRAAEELVLWMCNPTRDES